MLLLYDMRSGRLIMPLPDHVDDISAVAFSSDGQYLVSTCDKGGIQVCDLGQVEMALPGDSKWPEFDARHLSAR